METSNKNSDNIEIIASKRHTIIMVIILLVISLSSLSLSNSSTGNANNSSKLILYLAVALGEWALVYYIWIGIKKLKRISLITLISGKDKLDLKLNDLLIGLSFWIAANIILYIIKYFWGIPFISNTNQHLLPANLPEYISFFILSLSAGFCEEIIYRSYFQKQFYALFRHKWSAIILQGFLFGISHGYQGLKYMTLIFVYGILFGLLVELVKNLKPSILAHAWQDIFSGIIFQGS